MDLLLRDGREGKGRAFLAAFAAPGGGGEGAYHLTSAGPVRADWMR